MSKKNEKDQESLREWLKKAIDLLVHKQISKSVILSSYKINSVLKDNYGIDIKVDRIGRALSKYAKQENLKRLSTNIPKYQLDVNKYQTEIEDKKKKNKKTKE